VAVVTYSAALGALYCLATAAAANGLELMPRFPAYAGEDDFGLRFVLFMALVLPCFALLGGWVGYQALLYKRPWWRSCVGAGLGTLLALGTTRLMTAQVQSLASRQTSNLGVAMFFLGWLVLAAAGAVLASAKQVE
jgi:hypothetical protein